MDRVRRALRYRLAQLQWRLIRWGLPYPHWVDLGPAGGKRWIAEVVSPTELTLSRYPPGGIVRPRRADTTLTSVHRL